MCCLQDLAAVIDLARSAEGGAALASGGQCDRSRSPTRTVEQQCRLHDQTDGLGTVVMRGTQLWLLRVNAARGQRLPCPGPLNISTTLWQ